MNGCYLEMNLSYSCAFIDVLPVAILILHETELEHLVGKKNADVMRCKWIWQRILEYQLIFICLSVSTVGGVTSSNGGKICWKLMKEAVERYGAGKEPDEKRVLPLSLLLHSLQLTVDVDMIE